VLPLISYWVIVDTGSSDGTQEIIRNYFKEKGIPGELHERPWIDFATDRNFALELGRGKADYLMFLDADEILLYHPGFKPHDIEENFYFILAETGGSAFVRPFLMKSTFDARWEGVVHETLVFKAPVQPAIYANVSLVSYPDGARTRSGKKFHNDVVMLKKAYKNDPTNGRLLFYLARSHLANRQLKKAAYYFKKIVKVASFSEEAYMAQMDLGRTYLLQEKPIGTIVRAFEQASKIAPNRQEPNYLIAHLYRTHKNYEKAFEWAEKGIQKPEGEANIYLEKWVYQHGMRLEYMLAAYATGHKEEGKKAAEAILTRKDITQNVRNLIDRTLRALERGDLSPLTTVK